MKKADGILLATPESYEPDAIAATKRWYAETGRPVYVTGPLVPSPSRPVSGEGRERTSISMPEADTLMFLDEALKLSGKTSLVYVSRSSLWRRKPVHALYTCLIAFDRSHLALWPGLSGRLTRCGPSSTSSWSLISLS